MNGDTYFADRTGKSGLTNPELLLLDRFYSGSGMPLWMLYDKDFALHANLAFSHELSDATVRRTIETWVAWGWLEPPEDDDDGYHGFSLTPKGGAVWESERQPLWHLYCADAQYSRRASKTHCGQIISPSRQTAERFYRTARQCGLFEGKIQLQKR